MKKQSYLVTKLFFFLFSILLFSCSAPKMAYFNNSYESYSYSKNSESKKAVETEEKDTAPEQISASTEPVVIPQEEKSFLVPEEKEKQEAEVPQKKQLEAELAELKNNPDAPFEGLSKKEKRIKKRAIKKEIKKSLKKHKEAKSAETNTLLLVIIAILLPPLAVALVDGITGPFWISLLLTLLFYVPGLIYALLRIFRN